jgi:F420-non-reducing hydrogenase iron-sulfur subunit
MENEFEPKILAFCCNWCSYAAADAAGTARLQYPAGVHIIRCMCSGMIHPNMVMDALTKGFADGVLICGCHPGDCHYQSGNYKARRRVAILQSILEQMGFDSERVWLRWISASEGQYFADTVTAMVNALKAKGPNPLKGVGAI